MRNLEATKNIALKMLNDSIIYEYKTNKLTSLQISKKFSIPYYYIFDLTMDIRQFELEEMDDLLSFFKAGIKISADSEVDRLYQLMAIREAVINELNYPEEFNESESKGHLAVKDWLKENNISFKEEHTFSNLKYKGFLRFDFYIADLKTCIEFDGVQHFKPVDFFGGEDSFIGLKKRDKIKDNYCNKNNIKLIRVPYFHQDRINEFLSYHILGEAI